MVLVSDVQQNDSVTYVYVCVFFFVLFSIIGYYSILSIVPCAPWVGPCCLSVLYIVVCNC